MGGSCGPAGSDEPPSRLGYTPAAVTISTVVSSGDEARGVSQASPGQAPGGATLTTVRYAAFAFVFSALVLSLLALWRAGEAAGDRDNQSADFNDVVVTVALTGLTIVAALVGVTFAILA